MTKVNIISGFLGAGKTTFIKRLIRDVFCGEKLVLIENEFGEIGVDGGFLQDAGIEITEMNSGCICCTLVGDFTKALEETVKTYAPDRILIEPSGVGKLSDVIAAVNNTSDEAITVDACITVADCTKCKMYAKNFGEFYEDQIRYSNCVLLSRTDKADSGKIASAVEVIRAINQEANVITTPLEQLDREQILEAFQKGSMEEDLLKEALEAHHEHEHHHEHHHGECECGCHEHHHEHHDGECDCGCHEHHHEHHHSECECGCHEHHHDECECGCHEHHHEHHDGECGCHEHHHEHHHSECECGCHEHHHEHHHDECECGCHEHHHEHHHADEAFVSWGFETAKKYTSDEIQSILDTLDQGDCGVILRAKGIVDGGDRWLYFDYVPAESQIRSGAPSFTGKVCVIGANLDEDKLAHLFGRTL